MAGTRGAACAWRRGRRWRRRSGGARCGRRTAACGTLLDGDLPHADCDDCVGYRLAGDAVNHLSEDRSCGVLRRALRRRTRASAGILIGQKWGGEEGRTRRAQSQSHRGSRPRDDGWKTHGDIVCQKRAGGDSGPASWVLRQRTVSVAPRAALMITSATA